MIRDSRRTRFVLGFLLLVAFGLVTLDARGEERSAIDPLRGLAATLFGPIERAATFVAKPVTATVDTVGRIRDQKGEIDGLEKQNDELRGKLRAAELDRAAARQLDALLGAANRGRFKVIGAHVVGFGPEQGFSWTVAIDAGTRQGVRRDMTVVNGDGLVGRIVAAGPQTSTVLLAADPISTVGVRMVSSGEIGAVTGAGVKPMSLQLFDQQASLSAGDELVTFGSRGAKPFVQGIRVGTVIDLRTRTDGAGRQARVGPAVDFTALDVVGVVVEPPRAPTKTRAG
jgi:rod shape-determining protein MreC